MMLAIPAKPGRYQRTRVSGRMIVATNIRAIRFPSWALVCVGAAF
jgi:hypothetical protein